MSASDPRGLATVALLKTRFDEGKDHLGLFEPFVEDALRHCGTNNFVATDIRAVVEARTGLLIPTNTVQTLLGRFARAGYIQRAGGRFLRTSKAFEGPEMDARLAHALAEHDRLAESLGEFAKEHGITLTPSDALAALATFISANKVPLILHEDLTQSSVALAGSLSIRLARLVARFISRRCLSVPELTVALEGLVEGMILRDTLLLSDLADIGARFRNLTVAIDTPVLLAVLDLTGVANGIAAKEFLALLRDTGATTIAFLPTLAEMRSILSLYEHRLATAEGRLSLYPNEITQHVFAAKLTPADMRTMSSLLERRLADAGIAIRDTPTHDRRYTLDEEALAKALVFPYDPDPERPRIRHDVDCVAGILTMRSGRAASTIERSWAVFCSSSTQVVRNVQRWYQTQGEAGVPPIVHQIALSNIAWLKKPASARGIKLHELSAHCAAVLRPRKATWDKFIGTLRKLREDGTLSDDEAVAIVASDLAEPMLAQLDDDYEPDADTILDAIERVRRSYEEGANQAAAVVMERAQADVALAQQSATEAIRQSSMLAGAVENRVQKLAGLVSMSFYYLALSVLAGAAILSIPGMFEAVGNTVKNVARGVLLAAGVLGVISARRGASLDDYRAAVHGAVANWIRRRFLGVESTQTLH